VSRRTLAWYLTRVCIGGIFAGILLMIQPWVSELFRWGFLLLLASTVVYTVVSHFPERTGEVAVSEGTEELPVDIGKAEAQEPA